MSCLNHQEAGIVVFYRVDGSAATNPMIWEKSIIRSVRVVKRGGVWREPKFRHSERKAFY